MFARILRIPSVRTATIAFILAGCSSDPPPKARHPVTVRAPFDLDCPRGRVRYRRLDQETMGARGCGRRATYVRICREVLDETATFMTKVPMTDTKCQWVMDAARD